jgi:hypothetical protein
MGRTKELFMEIRQKQQWYLDNLTLEELESLLPSVYEIIIKERIYEQTTERNIPQETGRLHSSKRQVSRQNDTHL